MIQGAWHEVVLPGDTNRRACDHLLQHYRQGDFQEDLCFGSWTPSRGMDRETAIVTDIILPKRGERTLHSTGNVSFVGPYLARATREAVRKTHGLVFMHSHPTNGWQEMSAADERAERGRIADVARTTGQPLVGMTVGRDGHWSARVWKGDAGRRSSLTCRKVRIVEESRLVVWQRPLRGRGRRSRQYRTVQSWGEDKQGWIESVRIGVVGLGSVGSVVVEGLARIGVRDLVLIDHDLVEENNLDRLLNAGTREIGKPKTVVAARAARRASSARSISVATVQNSLQSREAYSLARDCDILVSCVDGPVGRDLLNRIAFRDGIPVIDGGVEVRTDIRTNNMNAARWKAHLVNPYQQCLRCKEQYTSSDVMMELDGSRGDPSYIRTPDGRTGGENVFNLSLAVGSELLNIVVRMLVADGWWPQQRGLERNLVTGRIKTQDGQCWEGCTIRRESWMGDMAEAIPYIDAGRLRRTLGDALRRRWRNTFKRWRIG